MKSGASTGTCIDEPMLDRVGCRTVFSAGPNSRQKRPHLASGDRLVFAEQPRKRPFVQLSANVCLRPIADIRWVSQSGSMARTIGTIFVMILAPPLLLFALAHLSLFAARAPLVAYAALIAIWAIGIGAMLSSGWSRRVLVGVGVAYTLAAVPILPFLGLLAVCSTGDCI